MSGKQLNNKNRFPQAMYIYKKIRTLFWFVLFQVLNLTESSLSQDYQTWIPKGINRTELKCPNFCFNIDPVKSSQTAEECCACHAKPLWELSGLSTLLHLEYIRSNGFAIILGNQDIENTKLVHTHGFLSTIPKNICQLWKIVEINLQYNKISHIGNISCLSLLDTLDLSYNSIESLDRNTFVGLLSLRVLRINNNGLKYLEPYTLSGTTRAIFYADLTFNNLTEIDISNIIPENNFCRYDLSSNRITEMINKENFALDVNKIYDGGFVALDNNLFTKFIEFSSLGIGDITILGKIMQFGFSLMEMKWDCDCQMEPYLELAADIMERIWRDYFNITCWNPPEYRRLSVYDFFVRKTQLDLLICDLSSAKNCPRNCSCYYQPKENHRTVVNCTGAGLTSLPDYVPERDNLHILLANNNIKSLEQRNYLNRTTVLDLSNNSVQTGTGDFFNLLDKTNVVLKLEYNNLTKLHRDIQQFDPCSMSMGKVVIQCVCEDFWIRDWLNNNRADQCKTVTDIYCTTSLKGVITALALTKNDICETEDEIFRIMSISFSVVLLVIIALFSSLYTFRYELFIIKRTITSRKYYSFGSVPLYDVFLSFDEENVEVRQWVTKTLEPHLTAAGYKSFLSLRDSIPGAGRIEELIESVSSSKNYVIVLCENYLNENPGKDVEWKYIWQSFRRNHERKVIIVNFDQLETSDIFDPKLKAFIRLSQDIDFANKKHLMFRDIRERLGMPLRSRFVYKNAKTEFISRACDIKL